MSLSEKKEKLSVKIDEKKANHEKRKTQAKINREERKLALKEIRASKKIEDHIEKAIKKVYVADDNAEKALIKLLAKVDSEIEAGEIPIEFIILKADNKFAEIVLNAKLNMQKANNELLENFQKDIENVAELASLEDDLQVFKDEMDEVTTLLDEKIDIEKETLALKTE